jgi:hypothetical protein
MAYSKFKELNSVAVDTVLADADAIDIADYEIGRYTVPDGSSITTITWYANCKSTADYEAAKNGGNAVTQTVAANESHEIPAGLFGARTIKGVGNADGVIHVFLKG